MSRTMIATPCRATRRGSPQPRFAAMGNPSALRIASTDHTAVDEAAIARASPVGASLPAADTSGVALASLRQLQHLRTIAIVGQVLAIAVAYLNGVALPV